MGIKGCLKKICLYAKKASVSAALLMALALTVTALAGCGAGSVTADLTESSQGPQQTKQGSQAASSQEMPGLADGSYSPQDFTWSGGSGKTVITCPYFTVDGGEVCAHIVFDSAFYEYVKLNGQTYDPVHDDGTSAFDIPLPLNTEVSIAAMTTAMSSPHEISYTIAVWYGELPFDTRTETGEVKGQIQKTPDAAAAEDQTPGTGWLAATGTADSAPDIPGLTFEYELPLSNATHFRVFYYNDGFRLLSVAGSGNYLVIPDGIPASDEAALTEGISEDITVIHRPEKIYMAATAVMSFFDRIDAMGDIAFSGTKKEDWTIPDAARAMDEGRMLYAGSYSEPDYELLLSGNCDLAIESTMIFHVPKVQEMLTRLGIPVLVDHSSYEDDPLGRTEWIKFYGALMGREDAARDWFDSQYELVAPLFNLPNTEKSVAYFYLASDGSVVVRSSGDYIPAMIRLAGGRYVFEDLEVPTGNGPSVKLSMEEFYATAKNADHLIYNGTIDDQVKSLSDLLDKSRLFADFTAVQNGNVWETGSDLYQATDTTGNMIWDLHLMLTGGDTEEMTFLRKLE